MGREISNLTITPNQMRKYLTIIAGLLAICSCDKIKGSKESISSVSNDFVQGGVHFVVTDSCPANITKTKATSVSACFTVVGEKGVKR